MHVLVVDDEVTLAEAVRTGLESEGFTVTVAHDGNTGYELARAGSFDAVVLDIMLPGRNGYRVCSDLRADGFAAPILMLTAKQGEFDEAEALDTGADDFLSKPFSFVVLVARLRALGRRVRSAGSRSEIQFADLSLDLGQRRCWRAGTEVVLTAREFDLLAELARCAPDVVSKAELIERVWGPQFEGDPNVVEVYVGYLRRKVDANDQRPLIATVRGHGYRLTPDA
jgi:DNA-binding response OmpR family regulator